MAMRLQSAPSIQPLNKDCLLTTRTTHQQNELLVKRCVAYLRIAALYKNLVHTYISRKINLTQNLLKIQFYKQTFLHPIILESDSKKIELLFSTI